MELKYYFLLDVVFLSTILRCYQVPCPYYCLKWKLLRNYILNPLGKQEACVWKKIQMV